MVPVSLGRSAAQGQRNDLRGSPAWLRPANITADRSLAFRHLIVWLAFFVCVGVLIALGHVWLRLKVRDFGYRLSSTRQVVEKLEQERHALRMEAATLSAPGRLEDIARGRLGMVRPQKGQEAVLR